MLLNLGCGDRYVHGWINVDHAGSPHKKDQVVDLTGALPWELNSLLHVYMGHVLEHLTIDACHTLLLELRPLVKPEGQIMIVGPDVKVAQRMATEGTLEVTLDSLKYGADRWVGDRHEWECTAGKVLDLLLETGWTEVMNVGIGGVAQFWPVADRKPRWQCAVSARSGL